MAEVSKSMPGGSEPIAIEVPSARGTPEGHITGTKSASNRDAATAIFANTLEQPKPPPSPPLKPTQQLKEKHELDVALRETKEYERELMFIQAKNALNGMSYITETTAAETQKTLESGGFLENKIADQIKVAKGDRHYVVDPGDLQKIKNFIKLGETGEVADLLNKILGQTEKAGALAGVLMEDTKALRAFSATTAPLPQKYSDDLNGYVKDLKRIVNRPAEGPEEMRQANQEVLAKLRDAFNSPAYYHLKEDEANGYIRTLHELTRALYRTPILDNLENFAARCVDTEGPLEEMLNKGWESLTSQQAKLLRSQGWWKNFEVNTQSALKSQLPSFEYDARGPLGDNSPGAYYYEGNILNVITPSPTIGGQRNRYQGVDPAFAAVLQSMQNRQLHPELNLKKEAWAYVNLQNITETKYGAVGGEQERSKDIMRLNDTYPFSFTGITLTKDSNFYKAGVEHNVNWKNIDQTKSIDDVEVHFTTLMAEMEKELINPNNFKLASSQNGTGYYFPGDEDFWTAKINAITLEATQLMKEIVKDTHNLNPQEIWELEAVAKEFVYTALTRVALFKKMEELGVEPSMWITLACKECIDRGGAENAKTLWALGGDPRSVLGCILGRAPTARMKPILDYRWQHFRACVKWCPQQAFQTHLEKITGSTESKPATVRELTF